MLQCVVLVVICRRTWKRNTRKR